MSVCQESDISYVPCSGMMGENLLDPPAATTCTEWYKGPTLLYRIGQHFHESTVRTDAASAGDQEEVY